MPNSRTRSNKDDTGPLRRSKSQKPKEPQGTPNDTGSQCHMATQADNVLTILIGHSRPKGRNSN
eukprot:scaffold835_cov133-Cylindrotheca_fusiformis.AAC.2